MNFKQPLNWLIVLVTLSLVFGPVFADQYRREIARWYLAAAANLIPANVQLAEDRLQKASLWAEDVQELRDYWLFQVKLALAEGLPDQLDMDTMHAPLPASLDYTSVDSIQLDSTPPDSQEPAEMSAETPAEMPEVPEASPGDVSAVIQAAIQRNPSNYTLGSDYAANELFESANFVEAVEVLEASCISNLRTHPVLLNQMAYDRALAGIELDIALRDIDQALKTAPDDYALRDTRAWVLFKMGRQLEALPDANFAIETLEKQLSDGPLALIMSWVQPLLMGRPEARSSDHILTRREAGATLWNAGALYYHRAKILQSLGRTEQAESDFQWLRDHQLPTDDRLY